MNIYQVSMIFMIMVGIQITNSQAPQTIQSSTFELSERTSELFNLANKHNILTKLALEIKISAPDVKSIDGVLTSWNKIEKSLDNLMMRLENDSHLLYGSLLKLHRISDKFNHFEYQMRNLGLPIESVLNMQNRTFDSIAELLNEIESSIKIIRTIETNISVWEEYQELGSVLKAEGSNFTMERIKEINKEIENIHNEIVEIYRKRTEEQKASQTQIAYIMQNLTYQQSLRDSLKIRLESNEQELNQTNYQINNFQESTKIHYENIAKQGEEEIAKLTRECQKDKKDLDFQKSEEISKELSNFRSKEFELLKRKDELVRSLAKLKKEIDESYISWFSSKKIVPIETDLQACEANLTMLYSIKNSTLLDIEDRYNRKVSALTKRLEEDNNLIRSNPAMSHKIQFQRLEEKKKELEEVQKNIHIEYASINAKIRFLEKENESVNNTIVEINSRSDRNLKELENKRDQFIKEKEEKEADLRKKLEKSGYQNYNHLLKVADDMKNLVQFNTEYSQMFNLLGVTIDQIVKQIRLTLENIKDTAKRQDIQLDRKNLPKDKIIKWFEDEWGEGPELQKLKKEPISGAQCNENTFDRLGIDSYFKKASWLEYCEDQRMIVRNDHLFKIIESEVNSILIIFDFNRFPKKVCVNQSNGTCKDEL